MFEEGNHNEVKEAESDSDDLSEEGSVEDKENDDDEEEDKIKGNYSGYLYKFINHGKKIKKYWFSLVYKDLYYYKSKNETMHKGMYNLSGVFLKE